jgi:hypothetical protein
MQDLLDALLRRHVPDARPAPAPTPMLVRWEPDEKDAMVELLVEKLDVKAMLEKCEAVPPSIRARAVQAVQQLRLDDMLGALPPGRIVSSGTMPLLTEAALKNRIAWRHVSRFVPLACFIDPSSLEGTMIAALEAELNSLETATRFDDASPIDPQNIVKLDAEDAACVCCHCDIQRNTYAYAAPCGHAFHLECIMRWDTMRESDGNVPYCPICRGTLSTAWGSWNKHASSTLAQARATDAPDMNALLHDAPSVSSAPAP